MAAPEDVVKIETSCRRSSENGFARVFITLGGDFMSLWKRCVPYPSVHGLLFIDVSSLYLHCKLMLSGIFFSCFARRVVAIIRISTICRSQGRALYPRRRRYFTHWQRIALCGRYHTGSIKFSALASVRKSSFVYCLLHQYSNIRTALAFYVL